MVFPHPRLRVQILRETLLESQRLELFIHRQRRRTSEIDADAGDLLNGESGSRFHCGLHGGRNNRRQSVGEIDRALARDMRIVLRQITPASPPR